MFTIFKRSWYHLMLGFLSGCCAACASVCGKFAFGDIELFRNYTAFTFLGNIFDGVIVTIAIRVSMFSLLLIFNMTMWTLFTKALAYSVSTIEVTVCNTAANFFVSAWLGVILFGERLSLTWWLGSCFIIAGLSLIHSSSRTQYDVKDSKE
ncbi:transmembrane protein 42-like isoform X2 [Hydractinia symbiolongicarpus]|uniref:transmembrane protein 42-like isoform X2 n=1 Tax=Hydractinia symbiolongicarpus TaxID=13093 RepID=UPI00254AA98C|nr:transmembrane protein 42-like isoform X2 [Hydractinia symbiolongicarpus]